MSSELELKNPHSVMAALNHRAHDVLELVFSRRNVEGIWQEIADLAGQKGISVRFERLTSGQRRQPKNLGNKQERTGSAMARVRPKAAISLEAMFQECAAANDDSSSDHHGLWLAVDSLQDPQNLGAIFRSAGFFGIKGLITTKNRAAPMSAVVYDVAAGGVESVPYVVVSNLQQAIKTAKKSGLWVLGTSEHAAENMGDLSLDRHWLIVLGNEQSGIRQLTTQNCDLLCSIPVLGQVTSLNAGVAAAITMAHFSGALKPTSPENV